MQLLLTYLVFSILNLAKSQPVPEYASQKVSEQTIQPLADFYQQDSHAPTNDPIQKCTCNSEALSPKSPNSWDPSDYKNTKQNREESAPQAANLVTIAATSVAVIEFAIIVATMVFWTIWRVC